MKSLKVMAIGLMFAVIGTFFEASGGGQGDSTVPFVLVCIGIIVFLVGIAMDLVHHDWTKNKKF